MNVPKTKGKAAVYLRKSTVDSRTGDNRSFARQMADIEKILEEFEVVAEFTERVGTSASHIANHDRPEWDQALAGLGFDYDVLIGSQMDRLSRHGISELVKIYDACEQGTGGRVVTCDWDSDSSEARIMGPIIAELARAEVARLQKRIVAGKKVQRDRKEFLGGPSPYAWDIKRQDDGTWEYNIIPERQTYLIEFAEMYIAGATFVQIGKHARDHGYEMKNGKTHWQGGHAVPLYLDHPSMAGHMQYDGETIKDDDGQPIQYTDPVLPPDLHAQYKSERMKRAKKHKKGTKKTEYLLSGLAFCSTCGGRLIPQKGNGSTPGDKRYACLDPYHADNDPRKSWGIGLVATEQVVSLEVVKLISELEPESEMAAALLTQIDNQINPTQRQHSIELDTALMELDDRLEKMRTEFVLGEIDEDEFDKIKETVKRKRAEIKEEQRSLPQRSSDLSVLFDWTENGPIGEGSFWASLMVTQKRDILDALIQRIEIEPVFNATLGRQCKGKPTKPIEERIHIDWVHESNVTELKTRKPAAKKVKARKAS